VSLEKKKCDKGDYSLFVFLLVLFIFSVFKHYFSFFYSSSSHYIFLIFSNTFSWYWYQSKNIHSFFCIEYSNFHEFTNPRIFQMQNVVSFFCSSPSSTFTFLLYFISVKCHIDSTDTIIFFTAF